MRRPRFLLLKTGTTAPAVATAHGDYDQWFIRTLGSPERFQVAEIFQGQALPDPRGFDGVLVTGSPLSVCAPAPWMEVAASTLREWAESGRAVLGVCFGHQLLCHAFGTPVIRNPQGREIGTVTVELTEAGRSDPLFAGIPPAFPIQTTHTDIASGVPDGTSLLARNAQTVVQAAAFGPRARGVQFHPELDAATMRTIIRSRAEVLRGEGIDPATTEAAVREAAAGPLLLRNFEERFAGA
jgi:GMP synthase (glutamine-hydrolysing)